MLKIINMLQLFFYLLSCVRPLFKVHILSYVGFFDRATSFLMDLWNCYAGLVLITQRLPVVLWYSLSYEGHKELFCYADFMEWWSWICIA